MLFNNYGGCGCGCDNYMSNGMGYGNNCWGSGFCGSGLGNAAFGFVGEWVNIVVTLTILQSILGLVCNWNCGCCQNDC